MKYDWILDWIRRIQGVVPPLVVELVLYGGARYYLNSWIGEDKETQTMAVRIWDFRAFSEEDFAALRGTLSSPGFDATGMSADKIHPNLDWAVLSFHYSDLQHCLEWHDRYWPEEKRPAHIGFVKKADSDGDH